MVSCGPADKFLLILNKSMTKNLFSVDGCKSGSTDVGALQLVRPKVERIG